ncbi:MAG: hypothetical protein J0L88_05195 [Xanthomonadales bacterium]|nr:hypothetical protein [Xanthomonadales bacterium]
MHVCILRIFATLSALLLAASAFARVAEADADFATVQRVLQHPRCANCHIPGDAPLQFDDSRPHAQHVRRGDDGKGAPGLPCSTCHGQANLPASYGAHVPPGAPNWHLPPAAHRMVFIDAPAAQLCRTLKDSAQNGGKDLAALLEHVRSDALVLWGWNPGQGRAPVPVPHADFVDAFRRWTDAGAPCPG